MQRQKRVLQLCHSYGPPFTHVATQWASLFEGSDWHLTTVFLKGARDPAVEAACRSDRVLFLELGSREIRGMKAGPIKALKALHGQEGFRLAIAHRYKPTYICCHLRGLPVVGVNHAFGVYGRRMRRWFANRNRSHLQLIGVSNAVRDDIRRSLPRFPEERIQTVYNRVDYQALRDDLLERAAAREALGVEEGRFVFANVGRLHPDKDQHTLLRAYAQCAGSMPDSLLLILGQGELEQELKGLAAELGLDRQVRFLGSVPDAARYYRAFDCFVLSSDHEPFGMVLLEAMAAGVPIISSDCGGAPEVVGDSGFLFPLGDAAALAERMAGVRQLDAQALEGLRTAMDAQAQSHFSFEAGRRAFWDLPFIRRLASAE